MSLVLTSIFTHPVSEIHSGLVSWSWFQKGGFRGKEVLERNGRYPIPVYFGPDGILEFPMTLANNH